MAKTIVFTKDDEINGVPMPKGTERSVSESIFKEKTEKGVAKEKTTTKKEKEGDKYGNKNLQSQIS